MKVVKPTPIVVTMLRTNTAPPDLAPEWVAGAPYTLSNVPAADQASHAPLVQKPLFSDALSGSWGANTGSWVIGAGVTASAFSSGELRCKDRDTMESSNIFAVTAGETFYVSFDVDSSGSLFGGAVGLYFTNASGNVAFIGVGYPSGKTWSRISGSIKAPAGATLARGWVQIDAYPHVDAARPYVSVDDIYVSRGVQGSGTANLIAKPTFADALIGGWVGNAGTANTTAATNSRGSTGMITCVRRDTIEIGNDFPVYPDETLYIDYDVLSTASAYVGAFGVMVKDEYGSYIAFLGVTFAPSSPWTHKTGTVVIPAGAVTATPYIGIGCPYGASYPGVSFTNLYLCRYPKGTFGPFVKRNRMRTVYARKTTGTSTKAPETDPDNWLEVGPINEWAMFDREVSSRTVSKSGSLSFAFQPGNINSLSLFGLTGATVSISVRNGPGGPYVYGNATLTGPRVINLDGTIVANWYQYFYEPVVSLIGITLTDLPPYFNAYVSVTIAGTGEVGVGLVDVGTFYDLGDTQYNPTLGIIDYSRKDTDSFGVTTFVKRGFAKRLTARTMIDNVQLPKVAGILADIRATPCAWSVTDINGLSVLNLFGWCQDFDIDVAYAKNSYCSLTIQGLNE